MAAEAGHEPGRCYMDANGGFHTNSGSFFDNNEVDIAETLKDVGAAATAIAAAATISAAEFGYIDGVTAGTAVADKAVVIDSNKDVATLRNVTVTNLDAGASGTAGTVDVFPATASRGKLAITCTNQTGDTEVSLVVGAMAAARTVTLRDPGAAASLLTTTDGTAAATTATAAEITRTCDVSTRQVLAGSTLAVTEALHDGKTILFDQLAGSVCTLPAAAGSGARFRFATYVIATSNSHIVKVANATDIFVGSISVSDAADDSLTLFSTTSSSDTITLNRTTTGSVRIGELIELEDIKVGFWAVRGHLIGTGGEATPFSATV